MKAEIVMNGTSRILSFIAVLLFMSGCATENFKNSRGIASTDTKTDELVKTYKLRIYYSKIGTFFTPVKHDIVGTISLDLEKNTVFWNQTPLKLVNLHEPMQGQKVFFDGTDLLYITGYSSDGKEGVGVFRGGNIHGQSSIQSYQTPNGSYNEFFSYFNQIKFPENYHGLIASQKYTDGTPIGIDYLFVASIQILGNDCLLNGTKAKFHRSTLGNGRGVIVVNNTDSNFILWPDGNWIFTNLKESGDQFGGFDGSLKDVYSSLKDHSEAQSGTDLRVSGTHFL